VTSNELEKVSPKVEAVRLAVVFLRTCMSNQSVTAPEKMRVNVNVAASMLVCFSAARQSSELLAKAIMANNVNMKVRALVTVQTCNSQFGNSAQNGAVLFLRAACVAPRDNPLVDLLPEPAAIRDVWENKLALVEGERVGAVVATER
jgi:hypothetical protein